METEKKRYKMLMGCGMVINGLTLRGNLYHSSKGEKSE
jgi:hypothetical protein